MSFLKVSPMLIFALTFSVSGKFWIDSMFDVGLLTFVIV